MIREACTLPPKKSYVLGKRRPGREINFNAREIRVRGVVETELLLRCPATRLENIIEADRDKIKI